MDEYGWPELLGAYVGRQLRSIVHNCVAHPLLVLPRWSPLRQAGEWLHDATAP